MNRLAIFGMLAALGGCATTPPARCRRRWRSRPRRLPPSRLSPPGRPRPRSGRRSRASSRSTRALGSVIAIDPTAIDQARRIDMRSRTRGPLAGRPGADQGQYRDRPGRCRPPRAAWRWPTMSPIATRRWWRGCAAAGRGDPRQDQFERMGQHPLEQFDLGLERGRRPDPQPLCARPQPVRIVERQRRRGRRRAGPHGDRHRDRRIGDLPGGGQRHRRVEADRRPGQPHPCRPDQPQPGHAGADDRDGARGGRAADRHRRQRPGRSGDAGSRPAQDRLCGGARRRIAQRQADRRDAIRGRLRHRRGVRDRARHPARARRDAGRNQEVRRQGDRRQ